MYGDVSQLGRDMVLTVSLPAIYKESMDACWEILGMYYTDPTEVMALDLREVIMTELIRTVVEERNPGRFIVRGEALSGPGNDGLSKQTLLSEAYNRYPALWSTLKDVLRRTLAEVSWNSHKPGEVWYIRTITAEVFITILFTRSNFYGF